MQEQTEISLEAAQDQLVDLMRRLNKKDKERFSLYLTTQWKPACDLRIYEFEEYMLSCIANDIKKRIPLSAVFPTEHIEPPETGENSDCKDDVTLHVDEFLYNDDDVDKLVDSGIIQSHYCIDCGSRNIKPLSKAMNCNKYLLLPCHLQLLNNVSVLLSHSMSRDSLRNIFNSKLPSLQTETILDIGSRLGAVLYGAYFYTRAPRIIGIEMNEELCDLQRCIIENYKMQDRIEIFHTRVEDAPEIVKQSNVIIINNPFEFYLSQSVQVQIWKFLKVYVRKGTYIVTKPPIEVMLKHLDTGIIIEQWLEALPPYLSLSNDKSDQYSEIAAYKVH